MPPKNGGVRKANSYKTPPNDFGPFNVGVVTSRENDVLNNVAV
jgi:hypothetical protein